MDLRKDHVHPADIAYQVSNACDLFGRVDRTLTGNGGVRVRKPDPTDNVSDPAYTKNSVVHINFEDDVFQVVHGDDALAHLVGVNHHEAGHLLFTPDVKELRSTGLDTADKEHHTAWNVLEDGRMERLMISTYASCGPFFTITSLNLLKPLLSGTATAPPEIIATGGYMFVGPRKHYLPATLVKPLRDKYQQHWQHTDAEMDDLDSIFATYERLSYPRDLSLTMPLVDRLVPYLHGIVTDSSMHNDQLAVGSAGNTQAASQRQQDTQDKADAQDEESGTMAEYIESLADEKGKGKGNSVKAGKSSNSKPKAKDDNGAGGDDDTDDAGDDKGQDGKGGDEYDDASSQEKDAGSGAGSQAHYDPNDVVQIAQNIIEACMGESDVKAELKQHDQAMIRGRSFSSTLDKWTGKPTSEAAITTEMRFTARNVGRAFSKIVAELDPGWETGRESGKLNIKRYMKGDELDTVFDQWNEDLSDASSVELVILVDMSSSMLGQDCVAAGMACWIIREGVQQIGAKVSGYGFGDASVTLFTRDDKNPRQNFPAWNMQSGTEVIDALNDAGLLLRRSKARTKVCVVLTDGEFNDPESDVKEACDAITKAGGQTVKFMVSSGYQYGNAERFDQYFDVNMTVKNPLDMVTPVKTLVTQLIRRTAHRR